MIIDKGQVNRKWSTAKFPGRLVVKVDTFPNGHPLRDCDSNPGELELLP